MASSKWAWRLAASLSVLLACAVLVSAQDKPAQEPKKSEPPKKAEPAQPKTDAQAPKADTKTDAKAAPQEGGPFTPEQMKKWQEFATPGQNHKYLEPLVGKFEYTMRWWMSPDAQPSESKGTSENKLLFDRYLQQDVQAAQPEPDGMLFRGFGLTGYDNLRKEYQTVWLDNQGTSMMMGTGKAESGGKLLTCSGDTSDPLTGQPHKKYRTVTRVESNDKHTFEMFETGADGKETRTLEIVYTRAK
jgi:hypothetical protein